MPEDTAEQVERVTHEVACGELNISPETLREWKSEEWFPDGAFKMGIGGGYDLKAIKDACPHELPPGDSEILTGDDDGRPAYVINRKKFSPVCPVGPDWHVAKVTGITGRVRKCSCKTCGHSFTQVGEFPDTQRETMHRISEALESAERFTTDDNDGNPVEAVLFSAETVEEMIRFLRGAIRAR